MIQERVIYFTNDADGIWRMGFSPVTGWSIWRGKLAIPDPLTEINPRETVGKFYTSIEHGVHIGWHMVMLPIPGVVAGLARFRAAAEARDVGLRAILLTEREPYKHTPTQRQFASKGNHSQFDELRLNPGVSASGWKEFNVSELAEQGYVVHIDDDLKADRRIARVNEKYDENRVLAYYVRNVWNGNRFIPRRVLDRLDIPNNVVVVGSYMQAALDFEQRLTQGWFGSHKLVDFSSQDEIIRR